MPVFYEIHKIFDVIQKLATFIAQVYISQNCAKFYNVLNTSSR